MFFDTHAHLNFSAFSKDRKKVINRSLKNRVWLINVGSQYENSKKAVEIASRFKEGIFASIGLHPIHAKEEFSYQKFKDLAKSKKVVAVGETGLDYKPEYARFKERQRVVFLEQLKLAQEFDLPVIFHCRMAHNDLMSIIENQLKISNKELFGVVHCFTGKWQDAKKYLDMGFYLGFNGIIFKLNLGEVIKKIPLNKILIETDCPYLSPPDMPDRNEPAFVSHIAKEIARIKNIDVEEVAKETTKNTRKLFRI